MNKRHILVVDDEPDIRNLVQEILGDEGFEVNVAENGVIARQLIKKTKPDLILLDDAFQSLYLKVDYNIVLHNDALNKKDLRLFPLGKLRQPLNQLLGADFIIQKNRDFESKVSILKWEHNRAKFIPNLEASN